MTVIAYRNGILAADGLISADRTIRQLDAKKIHIIQHPERGTQAFASTGNCSDDERVLLWLRNGAKEDEKPKIEDYFHGIVMSEDSSWFLMDKTLHPYQLNVEFYALGAGQEAATAAFCTGADTEAAVRAACNTNVYCGGTIQVVSAESLKR